MKPTRKEWAGLLTLLLTLVACSKSKPPPPPVIDAGPQCTDSSQCDPGEVCDANTGTCGPCKSTGQCKPHQNCQPPSPGQANACVYQAGWGDDCKLNDDCAAALLCKQGLCVPANQVTTCPNQQCPSGQRCNRTNLVCEQNSGCFTDDDCDSTELCNTATHACDPRCTDETAAQVCAADQKCFNGRCAQCGSDSDCSGGLSCDVTAGRCTNGSTCFSDADCDVPLVCNPVTSQCTQPPPPCVADEQCKSDETCDVPSGRCVPAACVPDRYEPNNSQATAAPLGTGPEIDVSGLTLCNGEQDYFSFQMLQGDLVQVVTEADTLATNTFDTTLLDPTGRALNRGDLVAQGQADSDGLYAVRVHSTDLKQSYGLRITIDHTSSFCQNDVYEPNDTPAQATRVAPPGIDSAAICEGDHDWFSLAVPAGLGVHVDEDSIASQGDLDLYVYASDGTTLLGSSATSNDDEIVDLPASTVASTTILILVQGGEPRSANQYSLQVSFRDASSDGGGP
jgi:hypothetical protein